MGKILVRDFTSKGYKEVDGPLPRTREDIYVPWAVTTPGNKVVYARIEESRVLPGNRGDDATRAWGTSGHNPSLSSQRSRLAEALGVSAAESRRGAPVFAQRLRPYDKLISQERRKFCHTALGLIALNKPRYCAEALRQVSAGLLRFLDRNVLRDRTASGAAGQTKKIFCDGVGNYMYGRKYMSFGRFSDGDAPSADRVWSQLILTLQQDEPVQTLLNIHDAVGRVFYDGQSKVKTKYVWDADYNAYTYWFNRMRAQGDGEIINEKWRGRKKREAFATSTTPGNLPAGMPLPEGFAPIQERNRGADMYVQIAPAPPPEDKRVNPLTSGNIYYQQLALRNELFGAGPSGTTGTALSAAFAFGRFTPTSAPELMKQYLFAVIGYLVGGGMHSLHESLSILRLIGLEYNTGTMLGYEKVRAETPTSGGLARVTGNFPLLPHSFLTSTDFENWRDEYYDIVMLGGTHWRFNK